MDPSMTPGVAHSGFSSPTSPAVQEESTEIPMAAPVVQQSADAAGRFTIAFVLPADITVETAPDPTDAAVTIRGVPASTAAALSLSGRSTEERFAQRLDELRAALTDAGSTTRGAPRFARFDAPIIPPLFRHNEVVIDVEAPVWRCSREAPRLPAMLPCDGPLSSVSKLWMTT